MKHMLLFWIITLSINAYSNTKSDSAIFSINIYGINMTEDMSTVSTHNDEILLLIYAKNPSHDLKKPMVCEYFVIDKKNKSKTINWKKPAETNEYYFILIEVDIDQPIKQLEPVLRVHFDVIQKAYIYKQDEELKSYLGDNELLAIKTITPSKKKLEISLTGYTNMDNYHYFITLDKE